MNYCIHLAKLGRRSQSVDLASLTLDQLASRAKAQSFSGRDIADVVGLVARIRGEKQLQTLISAIDSQRVAVPSGMSEDAFINQLASELSLGNHNDLRLPKLTTEEILQVIIDAKDLLRDKKKPSIGFKP